MPLYEYKCENCGEVFELIQKFSDTPLTTHEKCGGTVHRLLSAPALQFKGSGWYVNDYAKSGALPNKNGSDAKDGKDGKDAKSDDKSDSPAPAKTGSGSSSSSGDSAPASTSSSSQSSSDKPSS
jgi:putative FmdB family regulatory protein